MVKVDAPTYNLKAVVQETGLKPDTLRAWERRYGMPEPQRTEGGHRLYSQQDIQTLKWLLARQEEGMAISRAVALWHSLTAEGLDPLAFRPANTAQDTPREFYPTVEHGETVVDLRRAWIKSCLAFDERGAENALNQAFAFYSAELACVELLQRALVEIGNGWYEGLVTAQQEHFASALAVRRLDALIAATPAPTRAGRIIVGCAPGDNHVFGALLLNFLLRRRSWDVIYLGADVPAERLEAIINSTRPEVVIFSAQLLDTAAALLDIAHYLRNAQVPLAFGGYVFSAIPELHRRIPGHFLGNELVRAPQVVEKLILERPATPLVESSSREYELALSHFRERVPLITSAVERRMSAFPIRPGDLNTATRHFTRNIVSALKLGDLRIIAPNLQWLEGLLAHRGMETQHIRAFLRVYHEEAVRFLDRQAGELVVGWLAHILHEGQRM